MSKTTLIANSLTLSLGTILCLAILAYLIKLNLFMTPPMIAIIGGVLLILLTASFAVYLRKKFGLRDNLDLSKKVVLVNETWLLKHKNF